MTDMVDSSSAKRSLIMNELIQGKEIAKQLQARLISIVGMADEPSSSSSSHESLVQQIIMSFDKALKVLLSGGAAHVPQGGVVATTSEDSELDFEVQRHILDVSKKRKVLPQWTTKVRVCQGKEQEGPPDDGYSWRKYGQKNTLGAQFPRSYYRCAHRAQGCQATKRVQRTDEDPSFLQVIYSGSHCCRQPFGHSSRLVQPTHTINYQQQNQLQKQSQEIYLSFQTGLTVQTNTNNNVTILEQQQQQPPSSSLSFHSSSSSNTAMAATNTRCSTMLNDNSFRDQQNVGNLRESVTAAATSATDSPTPDPGFSFGQIGFDLDSVFFEPSFFD
ncbi:WRKY Transcription Factor [Ancistrocladus abbreviatus]